MFKYFDTPEKAIQNAEAESLASDDYIDFDGNNCNDVSNTTCLGWDGYSNRCFCGNRRISWATVNINGKYYAYADAC